MSSQTFRTPTRVCRGLRPFSLTSQRPCRLLDVAWDQWGFEPGNVLAAAIIPELDSATEPDLGHDSSTNALIRHYRALKK